MDQNGETGQLTLLPRKRRE